MSQVPQSEQVYYKDKYWNDHQSTFLYLIRLINQGLSESPQWWMKYFVDNYVSGTPLNNVLFINCGNGWAERELYDMGAFKSSVSFDYSSELLEQARELAGERPLSYIQADCNKVEFEDCEFDAVFNVAAMHHVQYIDRMNRLICSALKPDGLYVSFDYIGAHRNQYSKLSWEKMLKVSSALPSAFQSHSLSYPDLKTMMHHDPTEAIHSELIMDMFERYFYNIERVDLNGGIAYQVMHNNLELFNESCDEAGSAVKFILELDELYSEFFDIPALFAFFVGKPNKEVLMNNEKLMSFTTEEQEREEYASLNEGIYPGYSF